MNIELKHIKMHGFLSFGDAELDLDDKGFCSIVGINKCPRDRATSNGSGKSSLVSAISWAITGETIQGLKNNIANINLEDGCYVQLTFNVDNNEYIITRYKDDPKYKNDLKILVNGEDKSGKGIRESQAILDNYLPGLTNEVLGSVIILGQRLPQRFSNHSPSGRKELLEKLSKSDFMIEDIKNRIELRTTVLNKRINEIDTNLTSYTSKVSVYMQQINQLEEQMKSFETMPDYDLMIASEENAISVLQTTVEGLKTKLADAKEALQKVNVELSRLSKARNDELDVLLNNYMSSRNELQSKLAPLQQELYSLQSEIKRLESITDICPTCHQKIVGVEKPDTTEQKQRVTIISEEIKTLNQAIKELENKYNEDKSICTSRHSKALDELNNTISIYNNAIATLEKDINYQTSCIQQHSVLIAKYTAERDNFVANKEKIATNIIDTNNTINEYQKSISIITEEKQDLQQHLDVVNKMNTLIKRDFRGFLLTHVIEFIEKKAKEYCQYVFGSNDIEFKLDGNNIDISYCGKDFDNLSGGEQQKVDIILQFALRSMMNQYLGFSCNCLFLDEIFDDLDAVGCDSMIKLITEKLYDINSVFIISHRSGSLGLPNDSEIIVEKNEKGISEIR